MFTNSQWFLTRTPRRQVRILIYQTTTSNYCIFVKRNICDTVTVIDFKITFMGENWHFPWLVLGVTLFKQQNGAETQHLCMFYINYQPPNLATGLFALRDSPSIYGN